MRILRWKLSRLIKASICATLLISAVYAVCTVLMVIQENQCSNEESLLIIQKLCDEYRNHKVDGLLCEAICDSQDIKYQKCVNYRGGKKVLFTECNNVCVKDKNVLAVMKTRTFEGRHFEPLTLPTYKNKSLTSEGRDVAKMFIQNMLNSMIKTDFTSTNDVFQKLWGIDIQKVVNNAKYLGAENIFINSLWRLINQDEYLFMALYQESHFIPKIYGTCGGFYIVENAPPGDNLNSAPNLFSGKKGSWKERVSVALQILDIAQALDMDFHEKLHFCDVKEENFGIDYKKQVKIIDVDTLFFDTSMIKDLSDPKCTSHRDCDFFDCRGWCENGKCLPKRTNNNLQNICEDIFIAKTHTLSRGLLYDPPDEIAAELNRLLESCAYPNGNKGEIVRTPTPEGVFWKLSTLLKKSIRSGG